MLWTGLVGDPLKTSKIKWQGSYPPRPPSFVLTTAPTLRYLGRGEGPETIFIVGNWSSLPNPIGAIPPGLGPLAQHDACVKLRQ